MDVEPSSSLIDLPSLADLEHETPRERLRAFPWWFVAIILIAIATFYIIMTRENYQDAFIFIIAGLGVTIFTSLVAYAIALVIGLIAGLGRISHNVVFRNLATLYVELIRGIPMLVLIFYIALVGVPIFINFLKSIGGSISDVGLPRLGSLLSGIENEAISMNWRAIAALSVTYGAFLAEIFRAGIESIEKGQMEAARSLGMSHGQAMRYVILPQAIRNVLPALGNDFVAMIKDSSLVSVLAVRDVTQIARLFAGRSFRFREAYTVLAILYLTITVLLSLLIRILERRMNKNAR